jgi:D-amino-acid dehydrogenase
MNDSVHVLGAGMVGISCALELQRRGHRVTLIDRRGPGEETSAGNAGLLSYSNITPLASPALLSRLPALALNLDNDFRLHYPHLPSLLPWLLRFLQRCRKQTYLRDGEAMNQLVRVSVDLHREWIAQAGQQGLQNRGGALKLYRDERTFARDALERELLQICVVRHSLLDAAEVHDLEPALKPVFVRGVVIDDSIPIRDPGKLCRAYAALFTGSGGELRRGEVHALRPLDDGWELAIDDRREKAARLVVCLGAWTPRLLGGLGYANPLAIERGYHTLFAPAEGAMLTRPIFDVDSSYVVAPMEDGLRVTSGSNLVHRETQADPRQLERLLPRVREALPVGGLLLDEPWMGRRPTAPDTLPLIGAAPRHRNLWLAFAHAHMGFTLGPVSGLLIANFIDGSEQPFSASPCDPARWL